jgi:hypothetical protein
MSAHDILMSAAGNSNGVATYVEDVFSTYLYTGTGSTQTITNGIDLTTYGGLTWFKSRSPTAYSHCLYDTARNFNKVLQTDTTNAQLATDPAPPTTTANGFIIPVGARAQINNLNQSMASWTFRKQPKFFDIVTWTGNGVAGRTIAHSLGSVPGMIIVKRTDTTAAWAVYHRSLANTQYLVLNTTAAAATGATWWNSTTPTSAVFSVGTDASVNASGGTYVAYIYAHDAGGFGLAGTDNVISCGKFTGNSSVAAVVRSLGWEAQYVLVKNSSGAGSWYIFDSMRGLNMTGSTSLLTESSAAEVVQNADVMAPSASGFATGDSLNLTSTFIYMAIRRPNKPPTTGTQVYNAVSWASSAAIQTITGVGFAPDLMLNGCKDANDKSSFDRLRGATKYLRTHVTNTEQTAADSLTSFNMDGISVGLDSTGQSLNNTTIPNNHGWFFKRAPGFFDEVCYTGTGVAHTKTHNLGAVPELMIVKDRGPLANNWPVYSQPVGNTATLLLDLTTAPITLATIWNNTTPTSSAFTVGTHDAVNKVNDNYVAYLFATLAGVSKVGSYTGNGTSQTIACGFSAGARFILIKRTNAAGDWYVWDTVRGIITANDPHLSLNTTAAEVTTDDSIDPASSGFIVNQLAATNINVSAATYIFLAIS